jgi:tRNA threonylcarbamoyl adenosine modification protein YjeE
VCAAGPPVSGFATLLVDEEATEELGRLLGRAAVHGDVFALCGPLGAGKTTITRGLAEGLDVAPSAGVRSPTFTLCNEYPGRLCVLHIDLYRLGSEDEAEDIGLRERAGSDGVVIVEWADKLPALLPTHAIWIELEHSGARRRVTVWGAEEGDPIDPASLLEVDQWNTIEGVPPWARSRSRWF